MAYGKRCYRRPMKSSLVSATIHAVLVSLVVLLTPGIGSTRQRPPERPTIVIYRPPAPVVDGRGRWHDTGPVCQCSPPKSPESPDVPRFDVSGLPRIDVDPGVMDTWTAPVHDGGTGDGGTGDRGPASSGVLSADVVDVQVTPYAGSPTPRYPEALRDAGI